MYDIRLEGDTRALLRKLQSISELDRRDISADLAEVVGSSTIERFRHGRAPDGQKWKPSQRALLEGGKTLIKTAQLRNSIHAKADASGFAVGTNVAYAATHQFGEPGRTIRARNKKALRFQAGGRWISKKQVRVTIPARPFLGLSEEDEREIRETLEDFFEETGKDG
nr:phage virion morphogenesis protein [uncultured Oscillibacter sp.]